jgi:hypothetical protein
MVICAMAALLFATAAGARLTERYSVTPAKYKGVRASAALTFDAGFLSFGARIAGVRIEDGRPWTVRNATDTHTMIQIGHITAFNWAGAGSCRAIGGVDAVIVERVRFKAGTRLGFCDLYRHPTGDTTDNIEFKLTHETGVGWHAYADGDEVGVFTPGHTQGNAYLMTIEGRGPDGTSEWVWGRFGQSNAWEVTNTPSGAWTAVSSATAINSCLPKNDIPHGCPSMGGRWYPTTYFAGKIDQVWQDD